ncbi:MAG: NrsF family protein [Bryobacteraceae bacterium]
MIDEFPKPPEALLTQVAHDLRPVKPAPKPSRLVLWALPAAASISSVILIVLGLRRDGSSLGPLLTWGGSILQFSLAILLVWIAARESTPSHRLPKFAIYFAVIATALFVIALGLSTFAVSPTTLPAGHSPWLAGAVCGGGGTIAGIFLVILFARLFRHSLSPYPAVAGAIYGTGAGVAVNSGWRLACPISTPSHSLGAHGTAILVTALGGAVAAHLLARRTRSSRHATTSTG